MEYRRRLIVELKRNWQLSYRRAQDYPEGSDDQKMYYWMSEDYERLHDIVSAYRVDEAGLLTELYRLDNDTPFANIRNEIADYRKHIERHHGEEMNMMLPAEEEVY